MKIRLKSRLTSDTIAELLFVLYFSFGFFTIVFQKVCSPFGISGSGMAFMLLSILLSMAILLKFRYIAADCLMLYGGIILLFLITPMINPEIVKWFANQNWGLVNRVLRLDRAIYAYLIVRLVGRKELLKRDLKAVGYINYLYILYYGIIRIHRGYWEVLENDGITMKTSSYNMAYGYNAAFVAILLFVFMEKNNRALHMFLGLSASVLAVAFGSRGAILVIGSYFCVEVFLKIKEKSIAKRLFFVLLLALALILTYVYYTPIMTSITMLFQRFGISSRNLLKLTSIEDITASNSRQSIAALSMGGIREVFPFGRGAYGDRTSVGKVYAWGYSHNIALEMIASFGFLGIVFLLIIAVLSYKAIFRNEDETWRSIFILFFCCSVKLLVSDSFWFLPYFWAMFAVIKCQKSKRVGT